MFTHYQLLTLCSWLVSEIYWGVHSRGNKETVHRQRTFVRMFAVISIYAAFALIYVPYLSIGVLGVRLLPQTDVLGIVGSVLCGSGICFSVWSRSTLGKNWSGPVTLKKGHDLIRNGPYAIVRHPIYLGSLVSLAGSAMTTAEVRGFVGVLLVMYMLMKKMDEEESLLGSHFTEYADYRASVKKLIPFIY
jgi:protein-S-isoprenylcysteine O-methyltransferase Ste14